MRGLMVIVVALAVTQIGWGGASVAAERTRCVADGPFSAEVHRSHRKDGPGPTQLSALLSGGGAVSCMRSSGPTSLVGDIDESLTMIEVAAGSCFADTTVPAAPGSLRGRTDLTVTLTAPDGEVRRLDFHGVIDGTSQPDPHDPTTCALDFDVRAQAANGAKLTLQILAAYDRSTGTLTNALYSAAEMDTY